MPVLRAGRAIIATMSIEEVRAEARDWLAECWDPELPPRKWLAKVVEARWAVLTWPEEWGGRAVDADAAAAVAQEFRAVGAPGTGQDKYNLWANTLLRYGTDALKRELIRPLLLNEVAMCLLYSEPGAGSDLAGLATRADRDGDEFIVTGQKVWTSQAHKADYGMLVARTDWDVPKHRGISFFFLPMRQPGIEVRPIKQITGESHFNEVFIDNARVPAVNLLGPLNDGWRVLQTALAYERSVMGDIARGPRNAKKAAGDKSAEAKSADDGGDVTAPSTGGTATDVDLAAIAHAVGRADDPLVRQRIAKVHTLRKVNAWNGMRAKAQLEQGTSSPILSLGKLAMSDILHSGGRLQVDLLGAEGMLAGPDHPRADDATFLMLNAYFTSIGGGTDQIQRNIIGDRVLGLPREPEVDRDVPFRDVVRSSVAR